MSGFSCPVSNEAEIVGLPGEADGATGDWALEICPLKRQVRSWSLMRIPLGSCTVQYGRDGGPHMAFGFAGGRMLVYLSASAGKVRVCNGYAIDGGALCAWAPGARITVHVHDPGDWFAVALPPSFVALELGDFSELTADTISEDVVVARGEAAGRIRAFLTGIINLAPEGRMEDLSPEVELDLQRQVIREIAEALGAAGTAGRRLGRPRFDRRAVLSNVEMLLSTRGGEPVYISDLCLAAGVSERTLRQVILDQFGVRPARFLLIRRLCWVRRALMNSTNHGESVTSILRRFGFSHRGQFAADYKSLFGERPSETLRHAGRTCSLQGFCGMIRCFTLPGAREVPRDRSRCPGSEEQDCVLGCQGLDSRMNSEYAEDVNS